MFLLPDTYYSSFRGPEDTFASFSFFAVSCNYPFAHSEKEDGVQGNW